MEASGQYSVKDMLDRIVIPKLDAIDEKLDLKADRERVHDLANRLAAIEMQRSAERIISDAQVDDIREMKRELESLSSFKNKMIGGFVLLSSIAAVNAAHIWIGF